MSCLQVNNLDVRHGQLAAVRGVSMTLNKGDVVALIGANGAGKTTFLRAISGAHSPAAGTIQLNGNEITKLSSHKRVAAGLALVPEGRKLFSNMTTEENLLLGATSARSGEWNIEKIFQVFPNLSKRRHTKTGTMSGGEQQATAIGRALMSNPDILILDEVSLGLSPLVVDQVYQNLERLLATDTTIILVEQDLSRAMKVANRAICMLEGEIVLDKPMSLVTRDEITDAYFGLHKIRTHNGDAA
ncbi:ABC transporter ATP-binding protein [Marinomonas pollencensis]|uniref:Amino acid/amide ABC transporter ATP-binding protein 2 (HAAT family) n=1 Tax=Marinomonas pollencensis TaxID=491954 RepID=A0A3E0DIR4_9GAMM|nr:ABC transporter ATP-binding protein [Marinomonas pollencensis]REG81934.1 amino acid/amide ABC transporter ATP-binding protein 2 (HAAT family) [Marinomonas pollencensis]